MSDKKRKRWSVKHKMTVVMDLIKGRSLEELSREIGQPAHVISEWHSTFLEFGQSGLKSKSPACEKSAETLQDENRELRAKIGSLVMDNDLLYEKIARMENGVPFHLRKSKS